MRIQHCQKVVRGIHICPNYFLCPKTVLCFSELWSGCQPNLSFAFPVSKTLFCNFCNSTLLWLSGKPVRTHPLHCLPPAFTCCTAYMHLPFLRIKYIVLICTQYTVEFAYMHTMYCLYICILLYCIISICTQCTANMHQAVLWTTHIFTQCTAYKHITVLRNE